MGGPIAMLLAERHPALVSGLVLEATALEWRESPWEGFVWRTMAVVEFVLRLGPSRGLVERTFREAIETSPDLAPYRGWPKGERRRGDATDIAQAGRALGNYDGRPLAGSIAVPAAVVVTTGDRLVRPRKQRQLAAAIPGAQVFELAGDHDADLVEPSKLARVTAAALRSVSPGAGEVARPA